jgi:hypothetical protein
VHEDTLIIPRSFAEGINTRVQASDTCSFQVPVVTTQGKEIPSNVPRRQLTLSRCSFLDPIANGYA